LILTQIGAFDMGNTVIQSGLDAALKSYMILTLPPLFGALIVGITIGLFQAITQIQDQTLPQIFKILTVFGILVLMASVLLAPLNDLTERVFTDFIEMSR
jgi:type III secretion protein S